MQTPGKLKIDVKDLDVDMLSLSAHKLHAPKGIGLLYVKSRTKYQPYVMGGGQERGRRGGTENVANIVAFGRAAELAMASLDDENTRVRALRDKLEKGILKAIPGAARNGANEPRLPNTSKHLLRGRRGGRHFDGAGSRWGFAFRAARPARPVRSIRRTCLLAMGCSPARARGSVRFSLGIYNTEEEVDYVLKHLPAVISKLRAHPPRHASPRAVAA